MDIDIAIVGGGIFGSAVGFFASRLGCKVLLLERESVGGNGATKYSRGMVRVYDRDRALMLWNLEGFKYWAHWDDLRVSGANPYNKCGLLYLLDRSRDLVDVKDSVLYLSKRGYAIELIDSVECRSIVPHLNIKDGQWAIYEPEAGYCDPRLVARNLAESIRHNHGDYLEGVNVKSIEKTSTGVAITTDSGVLSARLCVLAAGAYAKELYPDIRQFVRTIPLSCVSSATGLPDKCIIDENTRLYTRPQNANVFYCGGGRQDDHDRVSEIKDSVDAEQEHMRLLKASFKEDMDMQPLSSFTGYDAYTEGFKPVLGFAEKNENLYICSGFSGRGCKYSLYIGDKVAMELESTLRVARR